MVGRSTPKEARVDSQRKTSKKSESQFQTLRAESTPAKSESTPRQRNPKDRRRHFRPWEASRLQDSSSRLQGSATPKDRRLFLDTEGRVDSETVRVDSETARAKRQKLGSSDSEHRVDSQNFRVDSSKQSWKMHPWIPWDEPTPKVQGQLQILASRLRVKSSRLPVEKTTLIQIWNSCRADSRKAWVDSCYSRVDSRSRESTPIPTGTLSGVADCGQRLYFCL